MPPLDIDGRATMAIADDRELEQDRRRARPGPYHAPVDRRVRTDPGDLELARRASISLGEPQRVDPVVRTRLKQLPAKQVRRDTADRSELWARIRTITERHRSADTWDAT